MVGWLLVKARMGNLRVARWPQLCAQLCAVRPFGQDLKCFGAALSACDHGRQWQAALALLASMESEGIAPGQIAYNCAAPRLVLAEAGNSGGSCEILLLYEGMAFHHAICVKLCQVVSLDFQVSACERSAQWAQALQLLEDMQSKEVPAIISARCQRENRRSLNWTPRDPNKVGNPNFGSHHSEKAKKGGVFACNGTVRCLPTPSHSVRPSALVARRSTGLMFCGCCNAWAKGPSRRAPYSAALP